MSIQSELQQLLAQINESESAQGEGEAELEQLLEQVDREGFEALPARSATAPRSVSSGSPIALATVEGVKQGKFKGTALTTFGAGKIPVIRFGYSLVSPRDVATGQASGKRQHKPVIITKSIDAATPQFFQAAATNEVLKSVLLEFVLTNSMGQQEIFYTITLTNATVAEVAQRSEDSRLLEDIAFTFQKIDIESKAGKTMAVDNWQAEVGEG